MINNKLKLSVCVMTYNQEKYIAKCLKSIVEQIVNFDFEVIVCDDCSQDGTQKIISEFAKNYPNLIKPIFHKKNIGAFENFLFVHDQANGEYVAHMDGDDYWLPGKLAYQADLLDKNPEVVQCWTCARLVDDDGAYKGIFPSRLARMLNPTEINSRDIALSYALVGHHSTQMYRREVRKRYLLGDNCLDYWIAFINSLSGKSIYSKKILSAYRVGSIDSVTRNKKTKRATVDFLSKHLFDISEYDKKYASEAKANITVRRFFSNIKKHDLFIIDNHINKMYKIKLNYYLFIKSFFYFILQKI